MRNQIAGGLIAFKSLMVLACVCTSCEPSRSTLFRSEMDAERQINTLHAAQTQFEAQSGRFAPSLEALGPSGADLIPADLAGGVKRGYSFTLKATDHGYSIQAVPIEFEQTGRRTFYSDQTLVLRQNWSKEPATAESEEVK